MTLMSDSFASGNSPATPEAPGNNGICPNFRVPSLLAWILLVICGASCLSPSLEEEPSDVNLPPHIAEEFVNPSEDVVLVESRDPVVLAVEALLDPNPEPALHYAFIGDRSGLFEQSNVSRQPVDERYEDVFYLFDRVEVSVDPCSQRLRDHDHELIRLYISDRPFHRVTESGVEAQPDGYVTSHRWLLRFRSQLCP